MEQQNEGIFEKALTQAEADLVLHENRKPHLEAAIQNLKLLLGDAPSSPKPRQPRKTIESPELKALNLAEDAFKGLGPSPAYRKFVFLYGTGHSIPEMATAMMAAGVKSKSRKSLIFGLHSVRRRDLLKRAKVQKAKAKAMKAERADKAVDSFFKKPAESSE